MRLDSTKRTVNQQAADGGAPQTGLLARLGVRLVRWRWRVLAAALVALIAAGVFGADVEGRLSQGGLTVPGSESERAENLLDTVFGSGTPHLAFLVDVPDNVDDPAVSRQGTDLTMKLAGEDGVESAVSYWTLNRAAPLRSKDGHAALILVRLAGNEDEIRKSATRIVPETVGRHGELTIAAAGVTEVRLAIERQSAEDLAKAELLSAPLALLILVLVFGTIVAAATPLAVGMLAVIGGFAVLRLVDLFTPVSVFAVNIVTAVGLGLAIDYSLFIVSRYREELAAGADIESAIATTLRTSGRTVIFSALTVAASLSAMLVFPMYQLRSFAYAGMAVTAVAALGAVLVLPALLAVLGHRIDMWGVRRWLPGRRARTPARVSGGWWHRWSMTVMRRPVVFLVSVTAVLITLGLPFPRAQFSDSDDRVLPADSSAHQTAQRLRDDFDSRESSPISVVLPGVDAAARSGDVDAYADQLSQQPDVARVDAPTGSYIHGTRVLGPRESSARLAVGTDTALTVIAGVESNSEEAMNLVRTIRDVPAPVPALVGGPTASLLDSKTTIGDRLPWAIAIMAVFTLVLLFLFTGSVLIPIKAIVMNLLSLTATFGAMVYIFQEGHLRWLVGDFTVTGMIDLDTPVLLFCVAFGLSMDYEVFLLSRMKEEYDRTGDNATAVAIGLERTGRLVTAAAAIIATVLLCFATSGLTPLKLLGVGLALAVLVDATLVRAILVPAFMRLAGRANWWAPAPLRRLHRRIGLAD